ncbi:melanocyte-stimulating hormone receptor-like [Oculina patagonica]
MNRGLSGVIHPNCFFLNVNLEQTSGTFMTNVLTCILNAAFSLLTSTGNVIILHVIWKKQELHSPSFVLLFCLAVSDLVVGVICQPFFVGYHIAEFMDDFNAYCALRIIQSISSYTTIGVSLATLSGISIDRLLALTLHLRYSMIVTVPRIIATAIAVWMVSTTVVISRFWMSTDKWIYVPVVILLVTFLVTAISILKIFQIVRRHQRQISQQQQSVHGTIVNALKCRKSSVTVLYVYGLLLIFYLPLFLTIFVETFTGYTITVKIAKDYVTTVVFINSFFNPLVYCWRIGEIRRAVKNALRKTNNEVIVLERTFGSVSRL